MCIDWEEESKNIVILIDKFVTECNSRKVKSIEKNGYLASNAESWGDMKLKITFDNDETIDFLCPGHIQLELLKYFCFPESNEFIKKHYPDIAQKIDLLRTN